MENSTEEIKTQLSDAIKRIESLERKVEVLYKEIAVLKEGENI